MSLTSIILFTSSVRFPLVCEIGLVLAILLTVHDNLQIKADWKRQPGLLTIQLLDRVPSFPFRSQTNYSKLFPPVLVAVRLKCPTMGFG